MISLSVFAHSRDIVPERITTDWAGFVEFLAELATISRPASAAHKRDETPAISPALYAPGATRGNDRVVAWGGWVALDIDNGWTIPEAVEAVAGLNHVIYSSTSHTHAHPKFRVILEADREIAGHEAGYVWSALAEIMPTLDRQCRDLSRIYYAPADWQQTCENPDVRTFWTARTDGPALPVDDLIAIAPPPPPPVSRRFQDVTAVDGVALDDITAIIRPKVLADYLALPRGEHYRGLYVYMCRVASAAIHAGVAVTAEDLIAAARHADDLSPIKTNTARWASIAREARSALTYARNNCTEPLPTLGMFGR